MATMIERSEAGALLRELGALRSQVAHEGARRLAQYADCFPAGYSQSAENLAHYLALRGHDLRPLQRRLARQGVSSLGRCEPYVLAKLDQIRAVLSCLAGEPGAGAVEEVQAGPAFETGASALGARADATLGTPATGRSVRIMVTLPSQAAREPELVQRLLDAGMEMARINCAHDGPGEWFDMVRNLRRAEARSNRRCLVHLDLPGHRLRTTAIDQARRASGKARLFQGDRVLLAPDASGLEEPDARADARPESARIVCSHPEALRRIQPGQAVWFDEGRLGGTVEHLSTEGARIRITYAAPKGSVLKPGKAINLPGASLDLPSMSTEDEAALDFATEYADSVGLSFVESRRDTEALLDALHQRGSPRIRVVTKIETQRGVQNLPEILLSTMGRRPLAVMIARGDLAVEVGGERLSEVQEEILWLCEAAHVPVIWATGVLHTLAKKGVAARSELTDAAMSGRAECVMLNKGPYIVDAVQTLDGILRRMQDHQSKKTPLMRALQLAQDPAPTPVAEGCSPADRILATEGGA